jgi:hypothetical protein
LGGDIKAIENTLRKLKSENYSTTIRVMAVNEKLSKLGIFNRYWEQVKNKNTGRFVTVKSHDTNFKNIPLNLAFLEENKLADVIEIYNRNYQLLCRKELNSGQNSSFKTVDFLWQERNRNFTDEEQTYYDSSCQSVRDLILKYGNNTQLTEFETQIKIQLP